MASFCPADHSLVVYTGYGVEKELSFYSLTKKQVPLYIFSLLHCISASNYSFFFFYCYFLWTYTSKCCTQTVCEACFYSYLQIIKKISFPHWATCISLSSKSHLVAVGSHGKCWGFFLFHLFAYILNVSHGSSKNIKAALVGFWPVMNYSLCISCLIRASAEADQVNKWQVSGLLAAQRLTADVPVLSLWDTSFLCGL